MVAFSFLSRVSLVFKNLVCQGRNFFVGLFGKGILGSGKEGGRAFRGGLLGLDDLHSVFKGGFSVCTSLFLFWGFGHQLNVGAFNELSTRLR